MHRHRMLGIFLLTVVLIMTGEAGEIGYLVYVGTYTGTGSRGIYGYRFDPVTGETRSLGLVALTENPSFLVADPKGLFLIAVNEVDTFGNRQTGAVSVFAISHRSGELKLLYQVSSLGSGPAYVSLDRSGRFVMVANYGGGNVAVFPFGPDGRLGRATAFMQAHGSSVNVQRQAGPHAHAIQASPDNRFALVADLGIDKLLVYDFDERTGSLTADSLKCRALTPGSGPRHFSFAPSGRFMYVVNELASSVTIFEYHAPQGRLEERQSISTLSSAFVGTNTAAEIVVDAQGKFVYVSNRGEDSIVAYRIDPASGTLTLLSRVACGGRKPRNIALDPTGRWLFCANQGSGLVTLFRVTPSDGQLTAISRSLTVVSPACVTFVPQTDVRVGE